MTAWLRALAVKRLPLTRLIPPHPPLSPWGEGFKNLRGLHLTFVIFALNFFLVSRLRRKNDKKKSE
jgi:hypothetical protein